MKAHRRRKPTKRDRPYLTEATARALTVIKTYPRIRPKAFAKKMWPDSPGWERVVKCGKKGAHKGGGMYRVAGSYIERLRKAGLIDFTENTISTVGLKMLKGSRQSI